MEVLKSIPEIPFPEYYEFFMDWKTVVSIASAYVVGVSLFNPSASKAKASRVTAKNNGATNVSKSSPFMTALVFTHNLVLAIYSAVTFYNMVIGLHNNYTRDASLSQAYCDKDKFFWNDKLGYWSYLFYLSKYYEVLDTVIILLKGRRSSLLQTYHHAGAMITMWANVRYRGTPVWIFTTFNSFVHAVMYTYYALTSVGIHPPGKKYITTMQITQFVVGFSVANSYFVVPKCVTGWGQKFALGITVLYLVPLTYLFVDFARKTYIKRQSKKTA